MALNKQMLAACLRAARDNRGLSQQEAADAIGLPRTAITQIESANRSVSTMELAQFADLYRCAIADFFEEQLQQEDDVLVALHRIAPNLDDHPEVKEQVSRCVAICREGADLQRLLCRSLSEGPPAYGVDPPDSAGEAIRQGAFVAHQERQRLGLGSSPIADMADLIASQGIWASGAELPDEMSGLFLRHRSIGMAILVNFDHARARKRFSYAHEYGHALMDRNRAVTVTTRDNSTELIEKRANSFAASFLMPSAGVREILYSVNKAQGSRQERLVFDVATKGSIDAQIRPEPGSQTITYQDIANIAHHFSVSYVAMTYRLRSLDFVAQRDCDELLQKEELGREYLDLLKFTEDLDGFDRAELRDRELRFQVSNLALEAYRREVISQGRLREIAKKLDLSGRKLLQLAEAARADS